MGGEHLVRDDRWHSSGERPTIIEKIPTPAQADTQDFLIDGRVRLGRYFPAPQGGDTVAPGRGLGAVGRDARRGCGTVALD